MVLSSVSLPKVVISVIEIIRRYPLRNLVVELREVIRMTHANHLLSILLVVTVVNQFMLELVLGPRGLVLTSYGIVLTPLHPTLHRRHLIEIVKHTVAPNTMGHGGLIAAFYDREPETASDMQVDDEDDKVVDDLQEYLVPFLEVRLGDEFLESGQSDCLEDSEEIQRVILLEAFGWIVQK